MISCLVRVFQDIFGHGWYNCIYGNIYLLPLDPSPVPRPVLLICRCELRRGFLLSTLLSSCTFAARSLLLLFFLLFRNLVFSLVDHLRLLLARRNTALSFFFLLFERCGFLCCLSILDCNLWSVSWLERFRIFWRGLSWCSCLRTVLLLLLFRRLLLI
jgi:hypothetical protein